MEELIITLLIIRGINLRGFDHNLQIIQVLLAHLRVLVDDEEVQTQRDEEINYKTMHILTQTPEEIRKSQAILQDVESFSSVKYIFFTRKVFFTQYKIFVWKKQKVLLKYSSLYSDIKKDIDDTSISLWDIENVRISLIYLTQWVEELSSFLDKLHPKNDFEMILLSREREFFRHLLLSFNADVKKWLNNHSEEISKKIEKIETLSDETTLIWGKEILLLQKKRLQSHMYTTNNI